jgi:hypothetical protein
VSRDGERSALGLFGQGDKLLEHQLAGGAGELVDIGGGQTLGGDGVEDCLLNQL